MYFRLIRIDSENPCKINLAKGTHVFGRTSLFTVKDKRIPRIHGQLEVTDDSLVITALHVNPCFYKKAGSAEVQILRKDVTISLITGDQLGLLPDSHWFQIVDYMPTSDESSLPLNKAFVETSQYDDQSTEPLSSVDNTQIANDIVSDDSTDDGVQSSKNEEDVDGVGNNPSENVEEQNVSASIIDAPASNLDQNDSASVLDAPAFNAEDQNDSASVLDAPAFNAEDQNDSASVLDAPAFNAEDQNDSASVLDAPAFNADDADIGSPSFTQKEDAAPTSESSSPLKRRHSASEDENGDEVKKIKTEEPEKEAEPKPGSSSSNDDEAEKPKPILRERCMYGHSCYRRNPQHLAQFSHPSDTDWGDGPRAPCPYGAACAKRDPRHWRDHDHPAGKLPPPPPQQPGQRVVYKNGNIFYINAQTVNFYDDHFEAEDSDGNSVDYDYEF